MPQIGAAEILVIMVVALLVFGPKRIPEVARQVAHGMRELRKIQDSVRSEFRDVIDAADAAGSTSTTATPAWRSSGGDPSPVTSAQPAPSRYRPAINSPASPGPATGADATSESATGVGDRHDEGAAPPPGPPSRPAAAPSRFRAPGA